MGNISHVYNSLRGFSRKRADVSSHQQLASTATLITLSRSHRRSFEGLLDLLINLSLGYRVDLVG